MHKGITGDTKKIDMTDTKKLIYPKGERVWTGYYNRNQELMFILTSKESREFYYLYELVDGVFRKLGKSRSPQELEDKFNIMNRIHGC